MSGKNIFDFSGRKIIVTGASSGIGKRTAIFLSECGAEIILIARREEALKETMAALSGSGHCYYVADLCEIEQIGDLFKKIVEEQGKLYGLVHCAGISDPMPLKTATYSYADNMMKINFFAFYELVRQFAKKGRYEENARIVSISSTAAYGYAKGNSIYSATKAATEAAIRILGQELISKNIFINAVRPGWVNTEMYTKFLDMGQERAEIAKNQQPLGVIEPEEVAQMIAYLMSDSSKSITGQSIQIGGGATVNG